MSDIRLIHGDCLAILRTLPDCSVDAVVTDPPYGLEFMGKDWDAPWKQAPNSWADRAAADHAQPENRGQTASPFLAAKVNKYAAGLPFQQWCELWATECLRVLKPGGHLLAFGGTRTWHRLACAVEDAGFEVRPSLCWLYGSGFPKSLNVSKALMDKGICRCDMGQLDSASAQGIDPLEQERTTGLSHMQHRVSPLSDEEAGISSTSLLPSVPGEAGRGLTGLDGREHEGPEADGRALRGGQSSLEGRGDVQAAEGQLHRPALRPLSSGVLADGAQGRLHHGAPASDGAVGRSDADSLGVREPHQPEPAGQPQGEPGAVSVERGSQAWGGWPVCERCSQPVIPDGLGTALKPAFEPVVVARKPLVGTVANNVLTHGTGALNVDACRIEGDVPSTVQGQSQNAGELYGADQRTLREFTPNPAGRWPANVVLDETQADALDQMSGDSVSKSAERGRSGGLYLLGGFTSEEELRQAAARGEWCPDVRKGSAKAVLAYLEGTRSTERGHDDTGGASRFFYVAKADASERVRVGGTAHPTVKPLALMRWLVRLVTPPGGTVLEPFAGSGTTVEACILEGFSCIAIEREAEYLPLIQQRIDRRRDPVAAVKAQGDDNGLFDLLDGGAA